MIEIEEGRLTFAFPDGWTAAKYDAWAFYRNQFQNVAGGCKAVDLLALGPNRTLWLIEVKDYRAHPRTKVQDLPSEIAVKVRDTLAALLPASVWAADGAEQTAAGDMLRATQVHVVLHLEQPATPSRLKPLAVNPADAVQALKQRLKAVDPHPQVVSASTKMAWTVRSATSP